MVWDITVEVLLIAPPPVRGVAMVLSGYSEDACDLDNQPIHETAKKNICFSIQATVVVAIPSNESRLNLT